MRSSFILSVLIFFFNPVESQEIVNTVKSPFSFNAFYTGESVTNFTGGLKKGTAFLGMANLKLLFETEKAGLWKNGSIFINAANTHGGQPSADLTGDFQGLSNIEAGNLTYLHELWVGQKLGKSTLVLGLQDLNTEFIVSEYAGIFLNSSFGVHSTIADNVPTPVFPQTALGILYEYDFTTNFSLKTAVFDGVPDISDNNFNFEWKLCREDGGLFFAEAVYDSLIIFGLSGTVKTGWYYHKHYLLPEEESEEEPVNSKNYGFYLVSDNILWKRGSEKQIASFIQLSLSPYQVNENWYYMGAGLNFRGFLPGCKDNYFGFAIARAGLRNREPSHETVIEVTYKLLFYDRFFVQPDFQYIINPSGRNMNMKNSFACLFRAGIEF